MWSLDAAAFGAFNSALNGLWHGISRDLRKEADPPRFEITFKMDAKGGLGQGRFVVRCLNALDCRPFGPGSADPGGGTIEVLDLESRSGKVLAQGRLRWPTGPGEMPFWTLERRMDQTDLVLTFDGGGFRGAPPYSATTYKVVLAEGAWPDAGPVASGRLRLSTGEGGSVDGAVP